jgi:hypothetical protein
MSKKTSRLCKYWHMPPLKIGCALVAFVLITREPECDYN